MPPVKKVSYEGGAKPTEFTLLEGDIEVNVADSTIYIGGKYKQTIKFRSAAQPGIHFMFGGLKANLPVGSLACDGEAYYESEQPELFKAIGHLWDTTGGAAAPGEGMFRVPKFKFAKAAESDSEVGTFESGAVEQHAHTIEHTHTANHDHNGHTDGVYVTNINTDYYSSGLNLATINASPKFTWSATAFTGDGSDGSDQAGIGIKIYGNDGVTVDTKNVTTSQPSTGNTGNYGGSETQPDCAIVWFGIWT